LLRRNFHAENIFTFYNLLFSVNNRIEIIVDQKPAENDTAKVITIPQQILLVLLKEGYLRKILIFEKDKCYSVKHGYFRNKKYPAKTPPGWQITVCYLLFPKPEYGIVAYYQSDRPAYSGLFYQYGLSFP
jgi:hypothetical protein